MAGGERCIWEVLGAHPPDGCRNKDCLHLNLFLGRYSNMERRNMDLLDLNPSHNRHLDSRQPSNVGMDVSSIH